MTATFFSLNINLINWCLFCIFLIISNMNWNFHINRKILQIYILYKAKFNYITHLKRLYNVHVPVYKLYFNLTLLKNPNTSICINYNRNNNTIIIHVYLKEKNVFKTKHHYINSKTTNEPKTHKRSVACILLFSCNPILP